MICSGICSIFCVLSFCSIKTWFKALWDIFSKICMRPWIRSLSNILPKRPLRDDFLEKNDVLVQNQPFWDLKNSNCRARPVGVGSDTPGFWNHQSNFQKHELLQKRNICMRPWIRSLSNISPKRPLRDYLMIPFIKHSKKRGSCGTI